MSNVNLGRLGYCYFIRDDTVYVCVGLKVGLGEWGLIMEGILGGAGERKIVRYI